MDKGNSMALSQHPFIIFHGVVSVLQIRCSWLSCFFLPCGGTFRVYYSMQSKPQSALSKKLVQHYFTNLCLLVIFISCQYDVKNSMRSAALCVHVSGSNCSGLIAFNHQCLYILKKTNKAQTSLCEHQFLNKLQGSLRFQQQKNLHHTTTANLKPCSDAVHNMSWIEC